MKEFNDAGVGKFFETVKKWLGEDSSAGKYFISMKNRMGIGDLARNAADVYERGQKIVPDGLKPNEGEIPVKQYNIAVLRNLFKLERAEGRMQVTNKRVIFRAAGRSVGGRTTLQHEFAINEIAGVEAVRNYKFSIQYLLGAILIICLSFFIITRCSSTFSGIKPSPNSNFMASEYVMSPSHVRRARETAVAATLSRIKIEENANNATEARESAQADETFINNYNSNRSSWREDNRYYNYNGRTRQEKIQNAVEAREKAEEVERLAVAQVGPAVERERAAIEDKESTENIWKILMTLLGLILGIGGLIPFFLLYKNFGLKLFLLNFSIFGFTLSLMASGSIIFFALRILSNLTAIVCTIIFCFRPNLVISIKNKMGSGTGPVDIRRNESMNRIMGLIAVLIGLIPVIFFWGAGIFGDISNIFDLSSAGDIFSGIGGILSSIMPIILLLILLPVIIRSAQGKNNESGLDSGFAEVIPTEETEGAIREIGAIIGDIQKLGDSGIEKWIKTGGCELQEQKENEAEGSL